MKEAITIISIIAFYGCVSYFVHRLLLKAKIYLFIFICLVYILFTNYFFDLIIYEHQNFRSKGIFLEFGHADIVLLEVFALCVLVGLINVVAVIVKRFRRKAGGTTS